MISDRVLRARMAEVGRIKIGGLEENIRTTTQGKTWQAPTKFDHFVITGMDRDAKGNFLKDTSIHSILGDSPRELKIRLLYNDAELNFRTELAFYQGKTCACRGDGETAQRLDQSTGELIEVACPCPKLHADKFPCKPHGALFCLLEQASLCGGVHKFATTGWNTISSIVSSLKFIQTCTGGKLAGLPLTLKYFKKATQTKDGKPTTIPIVTIVFEGNPVQMLEMAIETERKRISAGIQLETLEAQVRREIKQLQITGPLEEDEIPEFHPESDIEDATPALTINQVAAMPEPTPEPETTPATAVTPEPTAVTPEPTKPLKAYHCRECKRIATAHSKPSTCKCGSNEFGEHKDLWSAQDFLNREARQSVPVAAVTPEPTPAAVPVAAVTPTAVTPEPTPVVTTPEPTPKLLTKTQAQTKIVSLRAKNRVNTDQFSEILRAVGSSEKPADWTVEDANAVLAAMEVKYAQN